MLVPEEGEAYNPSLNAAVTSPKPKRHHIDLFAHDQANEVERLLKLGAKRVDWKYEQEADYVVLADPDGNTLRGASVEVRTQAIGNSLLNFASCGLIPNHIAFGGNMAKRKSPKEDKQPETKDNSHLFKIALITGIVAAIVTVIITAIASVLLKILDRTPTPPAVELEPASTQISAASTSVPADTTQLPSNASTAQYPISLSVDAEVKLNAARAEVVYKILETQIDSYNTENLSLKFLIRMTNNGTIDSPFGWVRVVCACW
ncbi:MAG: VOC family protein [Anaerolineales bacterium]